MEPLTNKDVRGRGLDDESFIPKRSAKHSQLKEEMMLATISNVTDEELLEECRNYASLYAELMERTERLKPLISKRTRLTFEHNGKLLGMSTGLYSTSPLEVQEHDLLKD